MHVMQGAVVEHEHSLAARLCPSSPQPVQPHDSWLLLACISSLRSSLPIGSAPRSHHRNFRKRLAKSPKLYFLDTGLLAYLLRIRSPDELRTHSSRGAIFESLVVSELAKNAIHRGEEPGLTFWRDSVGHEVDVILDRGAELVPVEITSGETLAEDAFAGLRYWLGLAGMPDAPAALVYGGSNSFRRSGIVATSWVDL
jgi:uncharacterized protein